MRNLVVPSIVLTVIVRAAGLSSTIAVKAVNPTVEVNVAPIVTLAAAFTFNVSIWIEKFGQINM